MLPAMTSGRIRKTEHVALGASIVLGLGASVWVFASREVSDFIGEGPVRLFGLEDGAQQTLIGIGTLVAVVVAAIVTWSRLPLRRYAAGGTAILVALALAPPLFVPVAALYALACAAAVVSRTPPERLSALAPRRHPLMWTGGGIAGLAALVVFAWVSIWLLRPLFDEGKELDEALAFEVATAPAAPASAGSGATSPVLPVATVAAGANVTATPAAGNATGSVLAVGQLKGADSFHFGSGAVRLLRGPDGQMVLRFEDYEVRNGPDLFVYLTPDPAGNVDAKGAVNLGAVKATRGNVNYEVPAGVDPSIFRGAVIWCRSFAVVFAVAAFE